MSILDLTLRAKLVVQMEKIAEKKETSLSHVVRALIWVGLGTKKGGGVKITGPFGIMRPFAGVGVEGERKRISVAIDEELRKELKETFTLKLRVAGREALQLGAIVVWPEKFRIEGPIARIERPFGRLQPSHLEGKKAKDSLIWLRKKLK